MTDMPRWNAPEDLERLARWLPVLEGRALEVRPPHGAVSARHDGRPDAIDAHDHDLRRAIAALERLEALAAGADGGRHVLVLAYCYLWLGPQERHVWAVQFGGLDARIGLVFATRAQRMAWLLNPARTMGTMAAARWGTELREAAEQAYAAAAATGGLHPRLDLASVRAQVADQLAATEAAIAKLRRVREQNRVKGPRR
jgi:hypothetical protein